MAETPTSEGAKVLLVEDDPKVGGFLLRLLTEEGFIVDWCRSGLDGKRHARAVEYDLVLLDLMLPDEDGMAVCRDIRARLSDVPVLMLTARSETRDVVAGLKAGADDYLAKPFEVDELIARMRALLRRTAASSRIRGGAIEIDPDSRAVWVSGARVVLTTREYLLLVYLIRNSDRAVSRNELLAHLWPPGTDSESNVVEVHVSRLREKLGDSAGSVMTVRGVGYQFRARGVR